jgi:hypothetical protein
MPEAILPVRLLTLPAGTQGLDKENLATGRSLAARRLPLGGTDR